MLGVVSSWSENVFDRLALRVVEGSALRVAKGPALRVAKGPALRVVDADAFLLSRRRRLFCAFASSSLANDEISRRSLSSKRSLELGCRLTTYVLSLRVGRL